MMNITLNITPAVRPTTGIGTYAKELISAILESDKDNRYTLFFSRNLFSRKQRVGINFIKCKRRNTRAIDLPYWFLNFLWNELNILPVEYICGGCDVFHSLDMLSPLTKKAKLVTTVHDVTWLVFDDNAPSPKEILYKEVAKSLERSDVIVADSGHTKQELLKYFSFLKEDRIEVVHLGVSSAFRPIDIDSPSIEERKEKYNWGEFILYIGELDKTRKNLARLVKAYSNLKRKNRIQEKLVLCGRVSKNSKELLRLIKELNMEKDIIVYSEWIPEEDIPIVYNMGKALVYPSLYEGFGLPILEAMGCGKPVITSNLTSIPEVAGNAAYYIDPYDIDDIAKGIEDILTNSVLYSELVQKGLEHVKKFTWQDTACKTIELYKKVFNSK